MTSEIYSSFCAVTDMTSIVDRPLGHCEDYSRNKEQQYRWAVCLNEPTVASLRRQAVISKRLPIPTTMPVATSSQPLLSSLPTFMSVFGNEGSHQSNATITTNSHQPSKSQQNLDPHSSSHTRRGSSTTTESTESSPTTTISTVDSTLTEPSPSSSPESPNILVPTLSSLKDSNSTPIAMSMETGRTISLTPSPTRQEGGSGSPNKRPRNAKGLSINTTGISTKNPPHTAFAGSISNRLGDSSAASLPIGAGPKIPPLNIPRHVNSEKDLRPFSEPSSPSFILPSVPQPRRSRLGLTITTPDSRSGSFGPVPQTPLRSIAPLPLRTRASDLTARLNTVPETPAFGPLSAMREGDEGMPLFSPSMAPQGGMQLPPFGTTIDPTLPTPSFGPEGGMRLPNAGSAESSPYGKMSRPPLSLPKTSFDAPNASSVIQHTIEHNPSTPLHDLPLSREAKSPGYPDGPICIYPPSVFLYHQPTREEARKFDVIINVAREVTNPFLEPEDPEPLTPEPRYKDAGVQCTLLPGPEKTLETIPQSAASDISFASAFESIPDEDEPETPKATSPKSLDPEYIHLPWEHNSKVYEDWLRICELIDNRVMKGKRVLVHCQLGVSRSASLIVAYGIYKNPSLTPDEAREQAKRQSRFIDLNMHFMYELGDFKKLLAEKFPATQQLARPGPQKPLARTMTDSILSMGSRARDPMSPISDEAEIDGNNDIGFNKTQYANASNLDASTSGPSSAPVGAIAIPKEYQEPDNVPKELSNGESSVPTVPTHIIEEKPSTESHTGEPLPLKLPLPPQAVHVENSAKNTSSLPSPDLDLSKIASTAEPDGHASSHPTLALPCGIGKPARKAELPTLNIETGVTTPAPRRSIRPMPSLPAGFNSVLPRRPESQFSSLNGLPLNISSIKTPTVVNDVDNDILSPRAAEFTATPFHRSMRSLAGDLAEPSFSALRSPTDHDVDPRSPPARGEVVVLRNIDDILG
jgi:tyrosine-protein phosphatase MSG5